MLRPTALSVKAENNYHLSIRFDNGETRILDVMPFIKGDWYGKLAEMSYFKSAQTDGFTVVWPEGQDLCPDDVYYLSVPVDSSPESQLR